MRVRFLLPGEDDLDALRRLDPDRDFEQFKRGERAWVLQTYLRLAAAGFPVELTDRVPADGIVVFHSKHRRWLRARGEAARDAVLVGIRGDLRPPAIADFEVLQNRCFTDGRRFFYVPHWPQPGLLPREPARGDTIRRIAYKGFARNLAEGFRGRRWLDFLAARGIEWVYAAAKYAGRRTDDLQLNWPDFRQVDLVLAVRPASRRLHPRKPATKLINAWLAGVPALLGAEVAYREQRRSPLDYLEVRDVSEASAEVDRLIAEPALYRAMRARCAERAAELTRDTWLGAWGDLLFSTIPRLAAESLDSPLHRLPLAARAGLRRLGLGLARRPAWWNPRAGPDDRIQHEPARMSLPDPEPQARRLLVWSYDPGLPSFRQRIEPLVRLLRERGWQCEVESLPRGRYVRRIQQRRSRIANADLLVLAKINLAFGEAGMVRRAARRLVFDFDDAIWVRKPRRIGQSPGQSWLRRRKFAATCRAADLVVAGNDFLAAAARRAGGRAETVPTPVDTARYPAAPPPQRDRQTLVWIGLPENLFYLELVRPALARLAERRPGLRLRVVSSAFPDWPEVPIERIPWSADGEAAALSSAGIGLMPLTDDEWTRGKCAFKLCQYMAAGLPCVASPVGANREAVIAGRTGLLTEGTGGWQAAIGRLLDDPELAERFGRAGRRRAEELYDRRRVAERTAGIYESLL